MTSREAPPRGLRLGLLLAMLTGGSFHLASAFDLPGPAQRRAAIGPLEGLPPALRAALDPADFQPIPKPGPDDWLANHRESPQPFARYQLAEPRRPVGRRRTIHLQPLGEFPPERSPSLDRLRQFAAAFFQMETRVLPALTATNFTTRLNPHTHQRQVLVPDVLKWLRGRLSRDAFCLLAITMDDLYPEPSWNFVFGQASLREGTGVYSFARYDPVFYGQTRGQDGEALILRRSCKVLAHETGHMFGLTHCVFFDCLMNGSNHLKETDARSPHLCPVCLRKLQWNAGWDVVKREQALLAIYREFGFTGEAEWTARRLVRITTTR